MDFESRGGSCFWEEILNVGQVTVELPIGISADSKGLDDVAEAEPLVSRHGWWLLVFFLLVFVSERCLCVRGEKEERGKEREREGKRRKRV